MTLPTSQRRDCFGGTSNPRNWLRSYPSGPPEAGRAKRRLAGEAQLTRGEGLVEGSLRLVVALAQAAVSGADGVSVSLQRQGRLATVAATDQTVRDMDGYQYDTGEGPCVDASVKGHWFHAESLDEETRWPAFTPKARAIGIQAILSNPLRAGERPIGALNIYSRQAVAFSEKEQELASIFAAEASSILGHVFREGSEATWAKRLAEALQSRETISQAVGVIMERQGVSSEEAYSHLRQSSHRNDRPLEGAASEVVASTRRNEVARHGGPGELGE